GYACLGVEDGVGSLAVFARAEFINWPQCPGLPLVFKVKNITKVTMAEPLGVLAGVVQLVDSCNKLILSFAEIRRRVRNAPERFRQLADQLRRLMDIALSIKQNHRFRTSGTHVLISDCAKSISAQAKTLQAILDGVFRDYTEGSVWKRYWKAARAVKEQEIASIIKSLDQEKCTLGLCLQWNSQSNMDHVLGMSGCSETVELGVSVTNQARKRRDTRSDSLKPNKSRIQRNLEIGEENPKSMLSFISSKIENAVKIKCKYFGLSSYLLRNPYIGSSSSRYTTTLSARPSKQTRKHSKHVYQKIRSTPEAKQINRDTGDVTETDETSEDDNGGELPTATDSEMEGCSVEPHTVGFTVESGVPPGFFHMHKGHVAKESARQHNGDVMRNAPSTGVPKGNWYEKCQGAGQSYQHNGNEVYF
ncbi:MAG: hypothetical protein Q9187_005930, partial [Circinaria calcarea]